MRSHRFVRLRELLPHGLFLVPHSAVRRVH